MVLLISTILLLLVLFISFYWLYSEKNKYRNPKLFSNLEQIRLFFETIENLDDYITWVHRDQIRLKFQPVAKFFKYKIRYYRKEKSIGDFFGFMMILMRISKNSTKIMFFIRKIN